MRNRCRDIVENWTYIEDLAEFGGAALLWPDGQKQMAAGFTFDRQSNGKSGASAPVSARAPSSLTMS